MAWQQALHLTERNDEEKAEKIDISKRLSLNTDETTTLSNKNTPKNTPSNRSKNIGSKIPILNSYYIADESTSDVLKNIFYIWNERCCEHVVGPIQGSARGNGRGGAPIAVFVGGGA